jgi:chromosome segregation ATPase
MSTELTDLIAPGTWAGALALALATLIKTRSSDRANINAQQGVHIERLTSERDEIAEERDKANDRASKLQESLYKEREARLEAESRAVRAEANEAHLREEIGNLARKSAQQGTRIEEQDAQLTALSKELTKVRQTMFDLTDLTRVVNAALNDQPLGPVLDSDPPEEGQ